MESIYLKNSSDINNLNNEQIAVLNYLVDAYKERFGENFLSLYVYGSVARGTARESSDLDNIAIVDSSRDELESISIKEWKSQLSIELKRRFPYIKNIDIMPVVKERALRDDWPLMMKLDGVIFYGEDLYLNQVINYDSRSFVSVLFRRYYATIPKIWDSYLSENVHDQNNVISLTKYFSKVALRLGMALVIVESDDISLFSNDVNKQWNVFKNNVPQFEELANIAYEFRYTENKEPLIFEKLGMQLSLLMNKLEVYLDFS